jgi:hypothetical protein
MIENKRSFSRLEIYAQKNRLRQVLQIANRNFNLVTLRQQVIQRL